MLPGGSYCGIIWSCMRACVYKFSKTCVYFIFNVPTYYATTNKHQQECRSSFLSAIQNKSSLSDKISTIAPTLYFPKMRPFQLSWQVKDYLRQVTALHSLLLRYRLSYSSFIVRPRTQSLRFADTRPKRPSVHFPRRTKSPRFWLGPIILYSRVPIADWLASGAISHDWPNLPLISAVRSDD